MHLHSLYFSDSQAKYDVCMAHLEELRRQVDMLGLFSINENIKEVNTSYLPFMLLPAYLATLEYSSTDIDGRKEHVEKAKVLSLSPPCSYTYRNFASVYSHSHCSFVWCRPNVV